MELIDSHEIETEDPDETRECKLTGTVAAPGNIWLQPFYVEAGGYTALDVTDRGFLYIRADDLRKLADKIEEVQDELQQS